MHKKWKVNRIAGGGSFICILIQVNFKEYVNKQKREKLIQFIKKNQPKNYMIQHMKNCIILSYKELILAFAGYHLVLLIVSRVLFDFLETAWLFKCSVFF